MKRLFCTSLLSLFISVIFNANAQANQLPPILDYYPNCKFTILDRISVKRSIKNLYLADKSEHGPSYTTDKDGISQVTPELLNMLRVEAAKSDADALILVRRELKEDTIARRKNIVILRFEAELLANCDDLTPNESKRARYTSNGEAVISSYNIKMNFEYEMPSPPVPKKRAIRTLNSTNVSLEAGVYGALLGVSEQQVYDIFGSPSAEIYAYSNQRVIGYGRKLWFHFVDD
jgi:hypothetical protein